MSPRFLIAVLPLFAACIVAVMVAPMASAEDVPCVRPPFAGSIPQVPRLSATLSITPVPDGHKVTVSGVLQTSSAAEALQMYKGARASFTLWGDDPDADDQLPSFYRFDYVLQGDRCGGQVYFWSSRFYNSAKGPLNEDSLWADLDGTQPGRDEIYADVRFGFDDRVETNRVYGYF